MSGPFLTGYTQTINDYYDREIDAINEPYRPIPSGKRQRHIHTNSLLGGDGDHCRGVVVLWSHVGGTSNMASAPHPPSHPGSLPLLYACRRQDQ